MDNLKDHIREVSDFPKDGINFYDITTLLKHKQAFNHIINRITERYLDKKIDVVVGTEARGLIIGAPVAHNLGVGFVPARKPGKLPAEIAKVDYGTEYSKDSLELHKDSIHAGQRVLIVDDLLATGGTAKATAELVESIGGDVVSMVFLIELMALNGREKLTKWDIYSMLKY